MILPSVMNLIGSPTKLQLQVLFFLFLLTLIAIAIPLTIPLYFQEPILICKITQYFPFANETNCTCEELAIDYANSPKSMTTEFSWICDRGYLKDMLGSIAYFAQSVGYLYFTFYKATNKMSIIYITSLINGVLMIIIYFITDYIALALIIGLYYFFSSALFLLSNLLLTNLAGDNQAFRCWSLSILFVAYGLSSTCFGLLGYFYFDWRIFFMCYVGLPLIFICLYYRRFNDPNNFPELHYSTQIMISNERLNPFRIFRYKSIRSIIITGALLSTINNINYYGSYYILDSLMGNIYFNLILLGTLEIFSNLLSGYVLSIFKRKSIMKICFQITGIAYMMFLFFDHTMQQTWVIILNISLALIGKTVIDINFSAFLVYISERLPKSVRQEGYGLINGIFRIFIAFIPQFVTSMKSRNINPFVGFAIMNILALFILQFITETFNKKIEDYTIEESEKYEDDEFIKREDILIH